MSSSKHRFPSQPPGAHAQTAKTIAVGSSPSINTLQNVGVSPAQGHGTGIFPPVPPNLPPINYTDNTGTPPGLLIAPPVLPSIPPNSNEDETRNNRSRQDEVGVTKPGWLMKRRKPIVIVSSIALAIIILCALLALFLKSDSSFQDPPQTPNYTTPVSSTEESAVPEQRIQLPRELPSCARDVVFIYDMSENMSSYSYSNYESLTTILDYFRLGPPNMTVFIIYVKDNETWSFKDFNVDFIGSENNIVEDRLSFPFGGKNKLGAVLDYVRTDVLHQLRPGVPPLVMLLWDGAVSLDEESGRMSELARLLSLATVDSGTNAASVVSSQEDLFYLTPEILDSLKNTMCEPAKYKKVCQRDVVLMLDVGGNSSEILNQSLSAMTDLVNTYKIGPTAMIMSIAIINSKLDKGVILTNFSSTATLNDLNMLSQIGSLRGMKYIGNISGVQTVHDTMQSVGETLLPSGRVNVSDIVVMYWDGAELLLNEMKSFYELHHDKTRIVSVTPNGIENVNTITATERERFYFGQENSSYLLGSLCNEYPKKCEAFQTPDYLKVRTTSYSYGGMSTFSCDIGYILQGLSNSTCLIDGTWSNMPPVCHAIDCGNLTDPVYGAVTLNTTIYSGFAQYSCNPGYNVTGTKSSVCQLDARWSRNSPTCEPLDCGSVSAPTNGYISYTNTTVFGHSVHYYCNTGYNLIGNDIRQCQDDQTWSGTQPYCQIVDCGNPPTIVDGVMSLTSTIYRSVTTYTCKNGYIMQGSRTIECLANGTWNETDPVCTPVDCGPPPEPDNTMVYVESTTYNSIAGYMCQLGYKMTGSPERTCMSNGKWSGTIPTCKAVPCGSIKSITFSGTCRTGYELTSAGTKTCLDNGTWVGTDPVCSPVNCGNTLTNPLNGRVDINRPTYHGQASYTCNTGYDLIGNNIRTCQADRKWSGSQPMCQIITCVGLANPANGVVTIQRNTFQGQASYTCNGCFQLQGNRIRTCQADRTWSGNQPICWTPFQPSINLQFQNGVALTTGQVIGQLMVCHQTRRQWTHVCVAGFDFRVEGAVACRQLGFNRAVRMISTLLPPTQTGNELMLDVDCAGTENTLFGCRNGRFLWHRPAKNSYVVLECA